MTGTESETFARLFHENRRAVLGYALRRVSVEAAQDVLAETFLIAWRRRLEMPAATLPWLLGVARNVTRQHYRNDSQQNALADELTRLRSFASDGGGDPPVQSWNGSPFCRRWASCPNVIVRSWS